MKGYALEVKLIEWSCVCKEHLHGACLASKTHKSRMLSEVYLGGFGYGVKTKTDAADKFRDWLRNIDASGRERQVRDGR